MARMRRMIPKASLTPAQKSHGTKSNREFAFDPGIIQTFYRNDKI